MMNCKNNHVFLTFLTKTHPLQNHSPSGSLLIDGTLKTIQIIQMYVKLYYLNYIGIMNINILLATYVEGFWTFVTAHNFSTTRTHITIIMIIYDFILVLDKISFSFFSAVDWTWFSN